MILDKLQKLGVREKVLMVMACIMIIGLIIDYGVVQPVIVQCDEMDDAVVQARLELRVYRDYLRMRQNIDKEYESNQGLLSESTEVSQDIDQLKGEVDQIAEGAGLTYDSMSHSDPVQMPESHYMEYLVTIGKYQTDMPNLLTFLRNIHQTPGMLRVTRLNVKPVKGSDKITGSIVISKVMISEKKDQRGEIEGEQ